MSGCLMLHLEFCRAFEVSPEIVKDMKRLSFSARTKLNVFAEYQRHLRKRSSFAIRSTATGVAAPCAQLPAEMDYLDDNKRRM